ncbi:hypothetical protein QRX60_22950 [Amycolatopsis mongoliensis]|uniref:ABC transporter substrate-binding protein n=1 Tax=Amycolatopsis mongoliensis TaxID=715475 RepID=A0A9Y2JXI6_9PSEU|nr:hypothetical protein [Amycolatopsis sp. 4-36]WIY06566.1 hypothetical protein QRX60_22950 [Amycolatopsis sp. 4-36]
MRVRKTGIAAVVAILVTAMVALFTGAGPASAAPAPAPAASAIPALSTPITGTFTDASGGTGTAVGTFTPTDFVADGSTLLANGVADVTLTDSAGRQVGTESRAVTVPAAVAAASCQILDLVLGPLDLNLLGLVVHLDRVHLNITAQSGPGNLLGNLLCAIAGLLDPGPLTNLQALVTLLNQILALLRG